MMKFLRGNITKKFIQLCTEVVKKSKKLLTIAAIISLLWSYVPWTFIDAITTENTELQKEIELKKYKSTTDDDFDPSTVALLSEDVNQRTRTTKTFRKIDGTYEISLYDQSVHYFDSGRWMQINNSLNDLGTDLENKANRFKLKIPKTLGENKEIKYKEGNYGIDWTVKNIDKTEIFYNDEVVEPNSIKEVINLNQRVIYENVLENVDLEYILLGDKVKENIILKEYLEDFSLTFEYKLKNLKLEKYEETYVFVNDNGEIIYKFADLFMYDNTQNLSYDVEMNVIELGDKVYEITIRPSNDWLKTATYPVIIDPMFEDPFPDPDPDPTYNNPSIRDKEATPTGVNENANYQRVGRYSSKNYKTYIEIDFSTVPDDTTITYSHLLLGTYSSPSTTCSDSDGCVVELKKVNGTSDWNDITNSYFSDVENFVEDYNIFEYDEGLGISRWDISKALFDWSNLGSSIGIIELSMDYAIKDNYVSFASESYSLVTGPNVIIGYQSNTGINNYMTYHSAPAGDAGVFMISDFTGELNLVRNDYTGSHGGMVIELGMFYSENLKEQNIGYGLGWRTNYNSFVVLDSNEYVVTEPSGNVTRYEQVLCSDVTDEPEIRDNTSVCYLANDGSRQILISFDYDGDNTDEIIVYTTDRFRYVYELGALSKIEDLKTEYFIDILFDNGQIGSIVDHYGNEILFEYDSDNNLKYELVNLCQEWNQEDECTKTNLIEVVEFIYSISSGSIDYNLSNINYYREYSDLNGIHDYTDIRSSTLSQAFTDFLYYAEKLSITYTYFDSTNEDNRVKSALSSNEYKTEIEYNLDNSVSKYVFTKGAENLGYIDIDVNFSVYQTKFTDHKGDSIVYTFDSYGHTVNTLDSFGYSTFNRYLNAYSNGINSSGNKFLHHKLVESSLPQNTQLNPISNHSFEYSILHNDDNWDLVIDDNAGSTIAPTASYSSSRSLSGEKAAFIDVNLGQSAHIEQDIILDEAIGYKLSGYVYGVNTTDAYLSVTANGVTASSSSTSSSGKWIYLEVTFDVISDDSIVKIKLFNAEEGIAYFDDIQVTDAFIDTRVNVLDNPSFESNTTGWTLYGATRVANNAELLEGELHDSILGNYSMKIIGSPTSRRYFEKTIGTYEFDAGNNYIVAGWSKGNLSAISGNLDSEDDKVYGIIVTMIGGVTPIELYFPFNSNIETWQYQANKFHITDDVTSISIKVVYQGEGTAYFDGVQVYKESFGNEYEYDDFGNISKIKIAESGEVVSYSYSLEDRFWNEYTEYMYLKKWHVRENGEYLAATGVNYIANKLTRNAERKVTAVTHGYDSNQDGVIDGSFFNNFYSYSHNQQYLDLQTNEFDDSKDFDFSILTGLLDSFKDENSVESTYTYDKLGRKLSESKDGTTYEYTYQDNLLTEVTINGMIYTLEYDNLDRLQNVLVNNVFLKQYVYREYGVDTNGDQIDDEFYSSGQLSQGTYGNNDTLIFNYNDRELIESVEYGIYNPTTGQSLTDMKFRFEYNSTDMLAVVYDILAEKEYYYSYDIVGRISKITDESNNIIEYSYDDYGNLSVYYYNIDGVQNNVLYQHETTSTKYDKTVFGLNEFDYTYETTGLRRLVNVSLKINSQVKYSKDYEYYSIADPLMGNTSYRIKSVDYGVGTNAFKETYDYDNVGNIISITKETNSITYLKEYFYDNKNQVLRENNEEHNYSIIYSYDSYGNVQTKFYYDHSIGDTPIQTTERTSNTYTYDTVWKDKLSTDTYVNSITSEIFVLTYTYDEIGNVILIDDTRGSNYDVNYDWEGRNLVSISKGSTVITYKYSQNGIRTSKTVNGVTTEYYLDGDKVLYETNGTDYVSYVYDVDGSLIAMNYNGTEYYYVTNLFGDITYIIDSTSTIVVEYSYDSYGRCKIEYDSGLGLGLINPYRYRGYRFDEETGLYYLQSRYYNPDTGRFINSDGIIKSSETVLGFNMFSYAENNPVMNIDPSGYNCYYQDLDGDGDATDSDGGTCGGSTYWTNGGTFANTYGYISPGTSHSNYSYNDINPTGINSGMGNMINRYGSTYGLNSWTSGEYIYGLKGFKDTKTWNSTLFSGNGINHTLYGEGPGRGGHMYPAKTNKTSFPKHYGSGMIMTAISQVYISPSSNVYYSRGYIVTEGKYDGMYIRVVTRQNGELVTAYPIKN